MNPRRGVPRRQARGFTLTELAVVVAILALLLGGVVMTMGAVTSAREVEQTQRTLDLAHEAITGFAVRNGRLPCPAPGGGVAVERFCVEAASNGPPPPPACTPITTVQAHGRCSNPSGFVPAATLGIGPVETNPASPNFGLLLDSWLQPVRYQVSETDAPAPSPASTKLFTAWGEMKKELLRFPTAVSTVPDLLVCTSGASAAPATPPTLPNCGAVPAFQSPAVIFSTGKNVAAVGSDETENVNGDRIFVMRTPTPFSPTPTAGFDDLVIWLSPNILYNRLIAAGAI